MCTENDKSRQVAGAKYCDELLWLEEMGSNNLGFLTRNVLVAHIARTVGF